MRVYVRNLGGTPSIKTVATPAEVAALIPSGTLMLFQQTSAPAGWTKQTTHNDKALRVVSGTAGSGGSLAFSTVFGRTATDGYALTIGDIPSHTHGRIRGTPGSGGSDGFANNINSLSTVQTDATGGGGAHAHGIDIRVHYVDVIIASKD
jgi:hypothetical protein